jgi:hypothetical protein
MTAAYSIQPYFVLMVRIHAYRAAAAAAGVRLLLLTSVPCLLHNFERLLLEAFRDVRAIEQAGSYLRTFAQ